MNGLSQKQLQIYEYICDCVKTRGYPPSVREICDAVGLKSPSTVHMHLGTLEKHGYISRGAGKTRAITLTGPDQKPDGIPVIGTVAAGQPLLAMEDAIGYIGYDAGDTGEFFALIIRGESMRNAGILDGDLVVVRRQSTAKNGEIVIALIEDEATCKRLSLTGGEVWLMPENENFEPINGHEASILGRVEAVIRQY